MKRFQLVPLLLFVLGVAFLPEFHCSCVRAGLRPPGGLRRSRSKIAIKDGPIPMRILGAKPGRLPKQTLQIICLFPLG